MQTRNLLLAAAFVLAAQWAAAEVLSPARALARATQSETTSAPRRIAAKAAGAAPALTLTDGTEPAVYVFAPSGGGLMAVSADSEAEAMLGYSDELTDGIDRMPPSLRMMLDAYATEIAALRAGRVATTSVATQADDFAPIAPLCPTRWDQSAPYNALCPTLSGNRCVTGCVATAMAQVLYTYKYPAKCSGGSFSYAWSNNSNQTLSLNFDNVKLDWNAMAMQYTSSQQAPAVAALMQAVGYSAQMNYSPTASGAQSRAMAQGLVRNFGYDATLVYEQRDWYPLAIWQKKVYDAIAQGHPLYYDGSTADYSSGHAFVIDGYSTDGFFHVNWGWGGLADGYYRLSALEPSTQGIGGADSGFAVAQGAIFGMKPGATTPHADVPLSFFAVGTIEAGVESASLPKAVALSFTNGGVYNGGPLTATSMSPAVKITASNGDVSYIHSSQRITNVEMYEGYSSFTVSFPSSLADGNYIIAPAVYNPSSKKYFDVGCSIGCGSTLTASVSNSTIYFGDPSIAILDATDVKVDTQLYPATYFNFAATLTNNSPDTFYGSAIVYLLGPTGGEADYYMAGAVGLELEPGESSAVSAMMELPSDIPTGSYKLFMADHNGYLISEEIPVTVATRPAAGTPKASLFRCTDTDLSNLTFKMTVSCASGLYADHVYLLIADEALTSYITYATGPIVSISAGRSQRLTMAFDFGSAGGTAGTSYYAFPAYYDGQYISPMPDATPVLFTPTAAGIEAIEAPGAEAPAEFFDLSGRRVSNPSNGIFIRRQGNSTAKIRL